MTTNQIENKLAHDSKCSACRGAGRRGRGRCRACEGKGVADLNHPRIRFNWGFHDAAFDVLKSKGGARKVVETGPQTTEQVSAEFNWWYARGYVAGILAAEAGTYENNSEPAWLELVGAELAAKYDRC